jgi:hypothetical protein
VIIGPMVGIITEAIVAEIVLTLGGKPRRSIFMLAGALGVAWVLAQPFVTGPLLFGRTVFTVWLDLLDMGSRLLGLQPAAGVWILLAFLAIYLVVGGIIGWFSWDIARLLQIRLGRPATGALKS